MLLKKGEKNSSILETKRFLANFSWIFEKMFKIFTGWKFEIHCLSSVFLSRGLTQATFKLLGKMLYLKLLFIAIDNGLLKGSAAILLKVGEILSWLIAFLGFNFWRHCLTLSLITGKKIVFSLLFSFTVIVLLIFKMLGWFL